MAEEQFMRLKPDVHFSNESIRNVPAVNELRNESGTIIDLDREQ
jgi:hypothetical protein